MTEHANETNATDETAQGRLLGAADIRRIAAEAGISPTKKFGQNFVIDPGTVRRIVREAGVTADNHVLEVGPGLGSLTLAILETGATMTAVEIDPPVAERLPGTIAEFMPDAVDRFRVVNRDALTVTPENLPDFQNDDSFTLVANLPYNVATPILLTLLERFDNLGTFLVMVQKEVADRLSEKPGSKIYGTPSVKLAWYGTAERVGIIGRNVFWPAPNVDSALVLFKRYEGGHTPSANNPDGSVVDRENVFRLIDAAFGQRRKTLHAEDRALRSVRAGGHRSDAPWRNACHRRIRGIGTSRGRGVASMSDTNTAINTVSVDCPAKTNLTLHVGRPRSEWGGRHELDTIYCAVGVYDTVTTSRKKPGSGFSLNLEGAYLGDLASSGSDMRRNHAVLALFAMAEASGHEPDVALNIEKRIPVGAGMAGGSADAAATILALNTLWNLDWSIERLQQVAATLGADMPFCLTGGYARGTGFGEQIEQLSENSDAVLELTDQGFAGRLLVGAYQAELRTPEVYAMFDQIGAGATDNNHLQQASISLHPRSGQAIDEALQAGAKQAFVSGSGPSVIAFVPTDDAACAVQSAWQQSRCVDRIIATKAPAHPIVHIIA